MLGLTYVLSHYYRTSTAVIGPDLMRELALSPGALSTLAAMFFIGFALAQIPVGIALDCFGPRRTLYAMLLVAAAGSVWFAFAEEVWALSLARATMGIGCAPIYAAAIVIFARRFPPDRLATLAGVVLAAGAAGKMLATTPLAWGAEMIGWRGTFLAIAAATLAIWAIGLAVVRDPPRSHDARGATLGEVARGVSAILGRAMIWRFFACSVSNYPAIVVVVGLWGGPYLYDIHGLGPIERGNALLIMDFALLLGYAGIGALDRLLDARKWIVIVGLSIQAVALAAVAALPGLPLAGVVALLSLTALAGGVGSVALAQIRALYPGHLVGRIVTVHNLALAIGVAALQLASGAIIERFPLTGGAAPVAAYGAMFGFLALVLVVAAALYLGVPEAKPSAEASRPPI